MTSVLALDLATVTGFAFAPAATVERWPEGLLGWQSDVAPPVPQSGSHRVAPVGSDDGPFYLAFDEWLSGLILTFKPSVVAYESPMASGGFKKKHSNEKTNRRLTSMAGVTDLVIARHDLHGYEAAVSTIRKHFCGSGRAKKPQVMDACRARGWAPKDDNAGDALALLDYAVCALRRRRAAA